MFTDSLTEVLRNEREIMTGIGAVGVRRPRVRDRQPGPGEGERIRFSPTVLSPYARRSKSLDVLIPVLYLKGVSTGDFEEVLAALVGKDAPGLSASTIPRLKEAWRSTRSGAGATSRRSDTSTFGSTASTWKPCSRTRRSVSWSSSAQRRKARRSWSASPTACVRARNRGPGCCSISSAAVCQLLRSWPLPTVRSASGRRSARCGRRRASCAAGCTSSPTWAEHWRHLRTTDALDKKIP
jgi:hypothetical protein